MKDNHPACANRLCPSSGIAQLAAVLFLFCLPSASVVAQLPFDDEPINYSTATSHDPIAQLQDAIDSDKFELRFDAQKGYLPAVLEALEISPSTQMLVFSKTSFQARRINPKHPRALYFRDNAYVGWVQQGDVVEVASVDPKLGPIFYTLDQQRVDHPRFVRDKGQCMTCHASSRTKGVPGLLVRSVFPDRGGYPILGSGTFNIDHTSPLKHRWGGWYVTGNHGDQRHMGNEVVVDKSQPELLDTPLGSNVTDLSSRLDVTPYLTPHSDIVALMVLEHQSQMQNLITRAAFEARSAMWYDAIMNKALDRPAEHLSDSTGRRIDSAVEKLVKSLLFCDEAELTAPIQGTSKFTEEFARRGPFDAQGRSLREFDLQTRLFKYPCSYLIYSDSFAALPEVIKTAVFQRLWNLLTRQDRDPSYDHLTGHDRAAILGILRDTVPDLPAYWSVTSG